MGESLFDVAHLSRKAHFIDFTGATAKSSFF